MHLWQTGKWTHWWMKPQRNYKHVYLRHMGKCTQWRWNLEETTKPCTSDTGKVTSVVNETLKKPVNHPPLTDRKVNSQVNETLMKPLKCAPLKQVNMNSLVKETIKRPLSHAHLTHGKVNSLLNKTLMKPLKCAPLTHGKVYLLEMKPWGKQ